MKTNQPLGLLLIAMIILLSSCTYKVYNAKPLPPGQAKKVYGTKSAKSHAPGQMKKR